MGLPIGFIASGIVLVPLWVYWLPDHPGAMALTSVSIFAGLGYALATSVVLAIEQAVRRRLTIALVVIGILIGVALGAIVVVIRVAICGEAAIPEACYRAGLQRDAWWVVGSYAVGCGLLGYFLALLAGSETPSPEPDR